MPSRPTQAKASTTAGRAAPRRRPPPAGRAVAADPQPADRPPRTNPAKVLFPATGFTKGQLVDYYERAAPLILPHLRGRALTLKRYPDGVGGKFFFEKRCPSHRPDWVLTARVDLSTKSIDFCMIDDLPTLLWVANLATIELHVPMGLAEDPDRPTAMVFDLDPGPPAGLAECAKVGLRLRDMLRHVGLECFAKLSGSKGLHVLVPLNTASVTAEQTKAFARAAALTLQQDDPAGVIATMGRSERAGKVFVDWSQNDRAKTTVCVYSVRARERPTVSAPVPWEALAARRMPEPPLAGAPLPSADPFLPVLALRQALPEWSA